MLTDHYKTLGSVSKHEIRSHLSQASLSKEQRVRYLCQVIEAKAYEIFASEPAKLCSRLQSDLFTELYESLANEQGLSQKGFYCPEPDAARLREGAFPSLQDYIKDWPISKITEQLEEEIRLARLVGGSTTREPIYTGQWWSVNLFDSSGQDRCPAAGLFPETLRLLLQAEEMQRSLDIVSTAPDKLPTLIARISWLGPHTRIEPHFGVNFWKTRLHLPIWIPKDNCFIVAGTEQRIWEKHQPLFLDDTYLHAVINWSQEPRIVLLIDIIHPKAAREEVRALVK
jgi:hypothetical protein